MTRCPRAPPGRCASPAPENRVGSGFFRARARWRSRRRRRGSALRWGFLRSCRWLLGEGVTSRKSEDEPSAAAGAVLRPDPSPVRLDQPLRYRQAQSRALLLSARLVLAVEGFKESSQRLLRDPRSSVGDLDLQLGPGPPGGDPA